MNVDHGPAKAPWYQKLIRWLPIVEWVLFAILITGLEVGYRYFFLPDQLPHPSWWGPSSPFRWHLSPSGSIWSIG